MLNGAGECTGFLTAAEWGLGRDAGLPDLDAAARPGLRRGLPDRAGAARRRRPTTSSSRWSASATTRSSTTPAGCRSSPTTCVAAWHAALASRGLGGRRRTRARSAPAPACRAWASRAASVRRPGSSPAGHTVGGPADDQLRRSASELHRRRRAGRAAAARPEPTGRTAAPAGSCIGIVVTDAPVDGAAARGWPAGSGSAWPAPARSAHHGSGEIFLAVRHRDAARPRRRARTATPGVAGRALDPLFAAVVEAAEEAVLNSMFAVADGRRAATATPARGCTPTRSSPLLTEHARGRAPSARSGSRWRDGVDGSPRRSTCPTPPTGRSRACSRRCPTARTT